MSLLSMEMLTPEQVTELWPKLEPYFAAACDSNEVAREELDTKDIYTLATTGMVAVLVGFEDGEPVFVMAIQFVLMNESKGANILAMAGRVMQFKAAYWPIIIEWLKANEVEFIEAHASERLAKIYLRRFGFNKSCMYVKLSI